MAMGLLTAAGNRYRCVFVVPSGYSESRINALLARGAEVVISDSRDGNDSHFKKANELAKAHPEYCFINQLENPANPDAHYQITGPEILRQIGNRQIHCFVAGVGSGGTISGVGKCLKEHFPQISVIAVQPVGCDVIAGTAVPHRIQGWAVGMPCPTLDASIIDDVVDVCYWEAIAECDVNNVLHGLFLGISSGANLHAAKKLAKELGPSKTILTISPDSGVYYADNYLEFRKYVKHLSY